MRMQSGGSGFIIDKDGTIVTNAHVVEAGAHPLRGGGMGGRRRRRKEGSLTVTLQDGRSFPAKVVNTDPLSDLAIVKLECGKEESFPTVKLGDSRKIRIGEWVVALGSPLLLKNTVTCGIISCIERKRSELGIPGSRTDYIQTDAAINVGNSGGPLVNLRGEVIGINSIKALSADGVSFAIPIETAKFVIHQILTTGRVVRPYIGIKMMDLSQDAAEILQRENPSFPRGLEAGVYVPQVVPGSPAEEAGFRAGDVIVTFGGAEVTRAEQIIELLGSQVGKRHQVVVVRDHGEKKVLYVTSEEAKS